MNLLRKLHTVVIVFRWLFIFSFLGLALLGVLELLLRPESRMAWMMACAMVVYVILKFKWDFLPGLKRDWEYVFEEPFFLWRKS